MTASNAHFDVIVVGLGAVGSAALYQLAKRGVKALGIDRFDPPHAFGSTHGESRISRLAVGEGPQYIPLARRSHEIWQILSAQTGQQLIVESGGVTICPLGGGAWHGGSDFVAKTVALAEAHHIAHEHLSHAQLAERMPLLKLKGNEHAVLEHSGAMVSPEGAVRVQLAEALRLGATVQRNTLVESVAHSADSVTVQTSQGAFSVETVILAAGPWIGDLLPPQSRQPLRVLRQVFYWFEAEDLHQFHADRFPWIIWIGDQLADFYSVFPYVDGYRPAVKMVTEQWTDAAHPDATDRTVHSAEIADMYHRFIAQRIGGLTDRCLDASVCFYTQTPDDHFLIDHHPDSDRIWVASPCSGHGFKHSAAVGEGLAELASSGQTQFDFAGFGFGRFD